jgi:TRAP transporter TAXI family solute receptor
MTAISSAGSWENIKLLCNGQAHFAILQGYVGALAWNGDFDIAGIDVTCPKNQLRPVTMLWRNVEHFVLRKDLVKTGNMDDLKGLDKEAFYVGKHNSGTAASGRYILESLGIELKNHPTLVYGSYGDSTDALADGRIHGMNTPGGRPVAAVCRAFDALDGDIRLLEFTDDQLEAVNADHDLWVRYEIPAGTYRGQTDPVRTIAQSNFLVARKDVASDVVEEVTRIIYKNLDFLYRIHVATEAMSLEDAKVGLPRPLHPGAESFFRGPKDDLDIRDRDVERVPQTCAPDLAKQSSSVLRAPTP